MRSRRQAPYLELGAAEGLDGLGLGRVLDADGHQWLTNVDTGDLAVGLAVCTTHTSLETICSSAGEHLVDADDVVGVGADADVEGILADGLDQVLVAANTASFESLGGDLLVLVGEEVHAEGELGDVGLLAAKIEDADLSVGDTTAEA